MIGDRIGEDGSGVLHISGHVEKPVVGYVTIVRFRTEDRQAGEFEGVGNEKGDENQQEASSVLVIIFGGGWQNEEFDRP